MSKEDAIQRAKEKLKKYREIAARDHENFSIVKLVKIDPNDGLLTRILEIIRK